MNQGMTGLLVLILLVLGACAKPKADPWLRKVDLERSERARALPADDRAAYEAGFADGAAMVHQSLKAGIRPFRPVLNRQSASPVWRGPVPEGVEVVAPPPVPEVDGETGLQLTSANASISESFARGQVDGFSWALSAIGQRLTRPVPSLDFPEIWHPYLRPQEGQDLEVGRKSVRLLWAPGHLAWAWKELGFPSQRTWRVWTEAEAPTWVGGSDQAIWVESKTGHVLALDLESGGILAVRSAVPHPAPRSRDWKTYQEDVLREFNSPGFQRELAALRQAAASGELADLLAVARRLSGMGEAAEREAFAWYLKAAEKGSSEAMLKVGVLLFHGQAIPADKVAAKTWLDRAIQSGHPAARAVRDMLLPEPAQGQ